RKQSRLICASGSAAHQAKYKRKLRAHAFPRQDASQGSEPSASLSVKSFFRLDQAGFSGTGRLNDCNGRMTALAWLMQRRAKSMGVQHPKYKVAVVQAAPVWLDLDATV